MPRQPTPNLLAAGQPPAKEEIAAMFGNAVEISVAAIRTDGGTQPRAKIDDDTVVDYAEAMRDGVTFPPLTVFHDGSAYYLADGFHRLAAAKLNGTGWIMADIRQGTVRDAVLWSVGANSAHGLRRSNDDKRRAVLRLLEDAEWGKWSNSEIARRCAVSHTFVNKLREVLTGNVSSEKDRQYITKHGNQATMNTQRIGQPALAPQAVILDAMRQWVGAWDDPADPLRSLLEGDRVVYEDFTEYLPATARRPDVLTAAQALLAEIKPAGDADAQDDSGDAIDVALGDWLLSRFPNVGQRRLALQDLVRTGPQNTRYWPGLQSRMPEWATPSMVREAAGDALQRMAQPAPPITLAPVQANGASRPAPAPILTRQPERARDLSLEDLRAALLDLFTLPASAANLEILQAAATAVSIARSAVNA